jgi:uncharacterized protein DUF4062
MTDEQPSNVAIRTPDQRLRVFVSSTLAELAEERAAVARAISGLRLTPVLFELGARPHPPRELYRAYLAQSDHRAHHPNRDLLSRRLCPAWPSMRRGEAELLTRVADEIDPEVFKDAFAAGSELGQREAVALVRGDTTSSAA